MTLTFGRSPFGHQRGSYNIGALTDHIAYVGPWSRRMRVMFGNRTVLDSRNGSAPQAVTPAPALAGDGQHWNLVGAGDVAADAAWSLPHPLAEASLALEHISCYTDKLDVMVDQEHVT